jgi:tetratricopeptide (TPR) repeat protein
VESLCALGRGDEAVEAARFLVTVDPLGPRARALLARALETAGQDAEARASYEAALEADQDYMPARMGLDGLLERQGKNDERVGLWLVAARRDPADPDLMTGLADALEADGRQEVAGQVRRRAAISGGGPAAGLLEELREAAATAADPVAYLRGEADREGADRAVILAELGRVLILSGTTGAPEIWKKVVELEPSDPAALAMLARSLHLDDEIRSQMEMERDPDALSSASGAMEHVLEMEPYWIWARVESAGLSLTRGDPGAALAVLESVTEDRADVWKTRMNAHAKLDQHTRAAEAGDRFLDACRETPEPADLLHVAAEHDRSGNRERARVLAESALSQIPEGPSALRRQAESYLD